MVGVSYATAPPPAEKQLVGLTYETVTEDQRRETRRSWNQWDVINTCIVVGLIIAAYIYFSG